MSLQDVDFRSLFRFICVFIVVLLHWDILSSVAPKETFASKLHCEMRSSETKVFIFLLDVNSLRVLIDYSIVHNF